MKILLVLFVDVYIENVNLNTRSLNKKYRRNKNN